MSLAAANPRPDKRASQIARRIEADVIRRGWPVGQSLGSEQALQQRYRVSRSVLREAVRLVEHHQVARMRRGPNGGLLVCEPDAAPATHAIIIYLEYVGTTIGDLLDARLLLEPLAASLAAQRIDEVGIDRLRAVLRAEEGHPPDPARPHDDFHAALAEQSKNPVLQLFIDILMRLTVRYAEDSRLTSARDALEAIDLRHRDHSAVVDAVTAGDAARAMTLSERHAESVTAWLQDHHQPRARHVPDRDAPPGKLAEVLAAAIRDDIASSGWQVGRCSAPKSRCWNAIGSAARCCEKRCGCWNITPSPRRGADPAVDWWWQNPRRRPASIPSRCTCSTESPAAKISA